MTEGGGGGYTGILQTADGGRGREGYYGGYRGVREGESEWMRQARGA